MEFLCATSSWKTANSMFKKLSWMIITYPLHWQIWFSVYICGNAGDKYNDEYQGASKKDHPDYLEDEDWESGNKSAADEAIERVKDIVGRGKGLDELDEPR